MPGIEDEMSFEFSEEMMQQLAQGEDVLGGPRKTRNAENAEDAPPPDEDDDIDTMLILDQLDHGSYPRLSAGNYNDSAAFCEMFLAAVKDQYDRTGLGVFECILVFPNNRTNDATVEQFRHSVATRISRIRRAAGRHVADFRVVFMHWEILGDGKHVLLKAARMNMARFSSYKVRNWKQNAPGQAFDAKLSNFL